MAPGRRKGGGRAAAAAAAVAAARDQYKVGDLVLAKVKGFPAWPATVSEPERWGYSSDWKKVPVYFFGTKQIGFCNPTDVEAFTEEKKKILLLKRQGKGADFVRAVDEIIHNYEMSKRQNQEAESNSADEGTVSNAGSSDGSKFKPRVNSPTQSPTSLHKPQSGTPPSSIVRSDSCNPIEIPSAVEVVEANDLEMELEEVTKDYCRHDFQRPLSSTPKLLRKSSRETPLQSCVMQRRPPPVRRSRSTSRSDAGPGKADDDLASDRLVGHDLVSAAIASNSSNDGSRSVAVAIESEDISLNEGSTIESNGKSEHVGGLSVPLENVELSRRLDLQTMAVVLKKRRKLNRKPVAYGMELDKETSPEVVVSNKELPNSRDVCVKSYERFRKADGDEHLPLVKRARARMGKLCAEDEQLDEFVDTKEVSVKEALTNHSHACANAFNQGLYYLTDGTSSGIKEAANNSSSSDTFNHFKENGPELWKTKKYHLRGSSVDGEAALPPSKRLHRALEAMSANVAEATYSEGPRATEALSNGCMISGEMTFRVATDTKTGSPIEAGDMHSSDNNTSLGSTTGLVLRSAPSTPEEMTKNSLEAKPGDILAGNYSCTKNEDIKEIHIEVENCPHAKSLHVSLVNDQTAESKTHSGNLQSGSFQCDGQDAIYFQSSPIMENGNKRTFESSEDCAADAVKMLGVCCKEDRSDGENESLNSVSKADDVGSSYLNGIGVPSADANGGYQTSNTSRSLSEENCKVRDMYEVEKEVKDKLTPRDAIVYPYSTSMKVLIAAAQAKRHFSRSNSLSDKVSFDAVSSSPPVLANNSSKQASPPIVPIYHVSASDDKSCIVHTDRSPEVNAHKKNSIQILDVNRDRKFDLTSTQRPKPLGKFMGHAEADAVWRSFEAMLETLSRTKESIGRATRLAIDCAKYGIVGEVVELLLHNLESESSLHRKVDLFFLVDSIIQCSRGQRGGIGDMYLAAVQPVLPRLVSAAAPPGNTARENHRQCLKVLRLWLERKTFPESIVRHYIRELSSSEGSFTSTFPRRPSRTERALNDPIREMEGMLVDEYGSNTSFQLPGFDMPRMLEDDEEEDATDDKNFEAVTPEHNSGNADEQGTSAFAGEKHPCILEDVDGELEMEDVSPSCEAEVDSQHSVGTDTVHTSQFEQPISLPFIPPLPEEMPPSPPPLPSSPPPMPPPPLSLVYPSADMDSHHCQNTLSMQNHLPQPTSQQPSTPNIHSTSLNSGPYYPPGYREIPTQMPTPISSYSTVSYGGLSSHAPMQAGPGNDIQQLDDATLPNKARHLHPPLPTVSNQFSYVWADSHQRAQSWMDSSSSAKKMQLGREVHGEHFYSHRGRAGLAQHEVDERGRFSVPSGSAHPHKAKTSYAPVPYHRPPSEHAPISNRGWSVPPRSLNFRHPVPTPRPPLDNRISGANGVSNFWRPR